MQAAASAIVLIMQFWTPASLATCNDSAQDQRRSTFNLPPCVRVLYPLVYLASNSIYVRFRLPRTTANYSKKLEPRVPKL
jgi:hypothetical protein